MPNESEKVKISEKVNASVSNPGAVDIATLNPKADRITTLEERLKETNTILTAVVIILLVMVAAMLIDGWRLKEQSYQELQKQIYEINAHKRR